MLKFTDCPYDQNGSGCGIISRKGSSARTFHQSSGKETEYEKSDDHFTGEDPERYRLAAVSSVDPGYYTAYCFGDSLIMKVSLQILRPLGCSNTAGERLNEVRVALWEGGEQR